jgi:hypothetical protein
VVLIAAAVVLIVAVAAAASHREFAVLLKYRFYSHYISKISTLMKEAAHCS